MKLSAARICALAFGVVAAALAVFADNALPQGMQAESFRYPIRDVTTGRKTADIAGDSWAGTAEGAMRIKGLRLSLYGIDDATNVVVQATDCICRLEEQTAESDSDVRIEQRGIIITGRGFTWSANDRVMKIRSRVRIEIGGAVDLGSYVASPGK